MTDFYLIRAINEGLQNTYRSLVEAIVCAHKTGNVVVHSCSGQYWVVSYANALLLVQAGYSLASLSEPTEQQDSINYNEDVHQRWVRPVG